jgi:hypothetical protein
MMDVIDKQGKNVEYRLDYGDFYLSFSKEDIGELKTNALLFIPYLNEDDEEELWEEDASHSIFLGTFTFNNSKDYHFRAFFEYNTIIEYLTSIEYHCKELGDAKANYFIFPLEVFHRLGLSFNNITNVEIALDTSQNVINKIRHLISDDKRFKLVLNGKAINSSKELENYGEFMTRTRKKHSRKPTLYLKGKIGALKVYDKAKEMAGSDATEKNKAIRKWNNMQVNEEFQRLEITLRHSDIKQLLGRLYVKSPMFKDEEGFRFAIDTNESYRSMLYSKIRRESDKRFKFPSEDEFKSRIDEDEAFRQAIFHQASNYIIKTPIYEDEEEFFFRLGTEELLRGQVFHYITKNILRFTAHNKQRTIIHLVDLVDMTKSDIDNLFGKPRKKRISTLKD